MSVNDSLKRKVYIEKLPLCPFHGALLSMIEQRTSSYLGSGWDSVGTAVAYKARGPMFKSSRKQFLYKDIRSISTLRKDKIKSPGMTHFKTRSSRHPTRKTSEKKTL